MDKLPAEILRKVFIHLSLEERIKYTLVCRKWWLVLDKYCLLYNVRIYNNVSKFNRFMKMIERLPHRANQVQKLILSSSLDPRFNRRKICNIFPNVRIVYLDYHNRVGACHYNYFREPIETTHSNSKVEILNDSTYCELTSQMLTSNLCRQLKELELDFHYTNDSRKRILPHLKGIPLLEKLILAELEIRISDIELIHANLPIIQDFRLHDINILSSEMPFKIVPANSIDDLSVSIHAADDAIVHSRLYRYLAKKYIHVTKISFMDEFLLFSDDDYARQIYENGGFDFLRLAGPKDTELVFCRLPDYVDIFTIFGFLECKIEELHILYSESKIAAQYLGRSKQSKYVKKLKISNSLTDAPHSIKQMTSLSTIQITGEFGFTLNLTNYLNVFPPSVKKFTISRLYLEMKTAITRDSSIEILEIEHDRITTHLEDIISSCFPKLAELRLSGEVLDDISIVLRSPSLKYVEFRTIREVDHGFRVKCGNITEPQYYLCTKENESIRSTLKDIKSKRILSLTTFANLHVNNGIKILPLEKGNYFQF